MIRSHLPQMAFVGEILPKSAYGRGTPIMGMDSRLEGMLLKNLPLLCKLSKARSTSKIAKVDVNTTNLDHHRPAPDWKNSDSSYK